MSVVVEQSLSVDAAHSLTNRIRGALEGTWELIRDAYMGRVWLSLGYESWDDYPAAEFESTWLRLPREERQEAVASLRDAGFSIRAISSGLGISDQAVQRDLKPPVVNHCTSPQPVEVEGMGLTQQRVRSSGITGMRRLSRRRIRRIPHPPPKNSPAGSTL